MTSDPFQLFSLQHLAIIALIPTAATALVWWSRRNGSRSKAIRIGLGIIILVNELAWYGYYLSRGWFTFPYSLPLHLCDVVLWLTVLTCFRPRAWSYELIYYWGLAGTTMAVLTPDVSTSAYSYLTLTFFSAHGGILVAILFMTWSGSLKPRSGSAWRALLALHIYAAIVGIFNVVFKTNYFYICEKPLEASLLDYMGPWPVYVIVGDILALLFFWLLWLPFRRSSQVSRQ